MTMPGEDLAPDDHLAPEERDIEAPEADAYEQAMPAVPREGKIEFSQSLEVNEYDALEQAHVVDLDDEYER